MVLSSDKETVRFLRIDGPTLVFHVARGSSGVTEAVIG
jgi:hypothetical protein